MAGSLPVASFHLTPVDAPTSTATDNGSCCCSHDCARTLEAATHTFTMPYLPQTNGKVCEHDWSTQHGAGLTQVKV